jgi:hypothetical protein
MKMKSPKHYIFLIVTTIFCAIHAYAQGTANPDELRLQIQKMIQDNNFKNLENYVNKDIKANSLSQLKSSLTEFVGAEELKVYVVAKQDQEAVKKMQLDTSLPGFPLRPVLEQRAKSIRDAGWIFDVEPVGDLMIVGKKVDPKSKGKSAIGSLYGVQNGRYVLVFARPK